MNKEEFIQKCKHESDDAILKQLCLICGGVIVQSYVTSLMAQTYGKRCKCKCE